jgi:hypothetical protein
MTASWAIKSAQRLRFRTPEDSFSSFPAVVILLNSY